MLMRLAVLGCAAAALLPSAPAPVAAPTETAKTMITTDLTVSAVAAAHRSRDGRIPVVVTLNGATRGTTADLEVTGRGVASTCPGRPLFDAARQTLTGTCYARLVPGQARPRLYGSARVRVGARLVTLTAAAAKV